MRAPVHPDPAGGAASLALPEGWQPGPPGYVGVGSPHAGASWWHDLIAAHPRVARSPGRPQSLHFFDDGWRDDLDEAAIARYHRHFARPAGSITGEWTAQYLQQVWTLPLLRRAAPDARLLVMLRDPVERFRAEMTTPREGRPTGLTPRAAANAAFSRGLYAEQLVRLWRVFPREQVLVLQYERCLTDLRPQLEHTLAFIGLGRDIPAGLDLGTRPHDPPDAVPTAWQPQQAEPLARHYAAENARLAALLPDLDLSLWRAPR